MLTSRPRQCLWALHRSSIAFAAHSAALAAWYFAWKRYFSFGNIFLKCFFFFKNFLFLRKIFFRKYFLRKIIFPKRNFEIPAWRFLVTFRKSRKNPKKPTDLFLSDSCGGGTSYGHFVGPRWVSCLLGLQANLACLTLSVSCRLNPSVRVGISRRLLHVVSRARYYDASLRSR